MRSGGLLDTALAALIQLAGLGVAAWVSPGTVRAAATAELAAIDPSAPSEAMLVQLTSPPMRRTVPLPPEPPPRLLRLVRLGTQDPIELYPFAGDGSPNPRAMADLARFFAPTGKTHGDEPPVTPDPRLVELLVRISAELDGAPLTLVSGHRRPGRGTSRKSYHVKGMAADIAVQGKKPMEVRKAALKVGAVGVGLYPGFVHVDARTEPYQWSGGGRRRR